MDNGKSLHCLSANSKAQFDKLTTKDCLADFVAQYPLTLEETLEHVRRNVVIYDMSAGFDNANILVSDSAKIVSSLPPTNAFKTSVISSLLFVPEETLLTTASGESAFVLKFAFVTMIAFAVKSSALSYTKTS